MIEFNNLKKDFAIIYLASGKAKLPFENVKYNDIKFNTDFQCDMLEIDLSKFDFIIATPPCNFWSRANCNIYSDYSQKTKHLLPEILKKLGNLEKPYIVENVINKKRMRENGIFDICDLFNIKYIEHGRHSYFTNLDVEDIIKSVPQTQDFKYGGKFINKGSDRQGGDNVNNVFTEIINYLQNIKKGEK